MKGESIIEVVVALGAGMVILTSLTLLMLRSLNNSTEGSSRTLATQYAQDGLEILKGMKDSKWSTLASLPNNTYCLADTCSAIAANGVCGQKILTCGANVASSFVREIAISKNDAKCLPPNPVVGKTFIKIISSVSYKDSNCSASNAYCHTIQVESCVSNDDSRATP